MSGMTPEERAAMREHARKVVAGWPPLTREQLDRLAVLFRPAVERLAAERRTGAA
jgi:hypothetical protein